MGGEEKGKQREGEESRKGGGWKVRKAVFAVVIIP